MSTAMNVAPKRLTKRQTAERLQAPLSTINHLIASGELKTVHLGNARAIILESDVDQLIARMSGDDRQAG